MRKKIKKISYIKNTIGRAMNYSSQNYHLLSNVIEKDESDKHLTMVSFSDKYAQSNQTLSLSDCF